MKKTQHKSEMTDLRQKAEEIIKNMLPVKNALSSWMSEPDALKLIHELEVHQVELGLQNEELMLVKEQAEATAEKYAELYEFAPVGYFSLSGEGIILELNIRGSQMLDKDRSKLINSSFGFFISETTKPIFNLFLNKAFSSEYKETCEVTLSIKGKSPVFVYLSGIVTENRERLLVSMIDISDRKQSEENLLNSEKKYRNLVENALIGVYTTNLKGDHLFVNDALRKILEYDSIEELMNSDINSNYKHSEAREKLVDTLKKSGRIFNYEVELMTKKGRSINVLINSFISGEELTGMIMDITDRKQAEEELKKKIDELQRFHDLTVGRELAMIELKKEVNGLLLKSGQQEKYRIVG